MTSKEKAIELLEKFRTHTYNGEDNQYSENAKQCALIAVDEIIELLDFDLGHDSTARALSEEYKQVRSEIEKL
jgi:hypothetical protein